MGNNMIQKGGGEVAQPHLKIERGDFMVKVQQQQQLRVLLQKMYCQLFRLLLQKMYCQLFRLLLQKMYCQLFRLLLQKY